MPAEKHYAYHEELENCNYTLKYVDKAYENAIERKTRIDTDLAYIQKHFDSSSSSDYINMMINTLLHDSLELKIRNLITAKSKPYFARVDFRENGSEKTEKLYIGKMSLMRDEDQEMIIVDWRAPISNLYYEGRLGKAAYNSPSGSINGELLVKRQFSINNGELQEIFDIDITTNDDFLQSYLGANASNRLKEIVSTIQVEQNEIIRADMWTPLIVQGAAGSGKTTIALHRIAYLIYTYEKDFKPENFMIIAPTRLFLNYISEVLPELGVERVRQTTFEEFALDLIGNKKLKIKDPNEKLNLFINSNTSTQQAERNRLLMESSKLKASMVFKEMLDRYISTVEHTFIPKEDFCIGPTIIYKYSELNDLFINSYKVWPVAQRINEIKKHMTSRLKHKKDSIINGLHIESDIKIKRIKLTEEESEERQQKIIDIIDTRNKTIEKIESYSKKAVNEYIQKISKLNPYEYYKDFITDSQLFKAIASEMGVAPEISDFTQRHTEGTLKEKYIELEDIAPIIYLKFCIYGMDEKIPVKHIVIDEAQDFSAFQLYVLRRIIKDSSFTILGDLNQGIHSYRGVQSWDEISQHVFQDKKIRYLTLEQSYRTTVEIMEAANKVIGKLKRNDIPPARPVIRHGEKVSLIQKASFKETASDIIKRTAEFRKMGYKSIAVICKTTDECTAMHKLLKKDLDEIYVISGREAAYKSGMVIVPSHLAKGLEFDVVFIADGTAEVYGENELDTKLLYVAMTRALHRLHIYYTGKLSPLLEGLEV